MSWLGVLALRADDAPVGDDDGWVDVGVVALVADAADAVKCAPSTWPQMHIGSGLLSSRVSRRLIRLRGIASAVRTPICAPIQPASC